MGLLASESGLTARFLPRIAAMLFQRGFFQWQRWRPDGPF